jgi:hypothetical protein
MLLAVELVDVRVAGFVLGRVREIRQRMALAEPIDERSRPVEIRTTQPVRNQDGERLAALDREMQEPIGGVAMEPQRVNMTDGGTGPVGTSTNARNVGTLRGQLPVTGRDGALREPTGWGVL